MAFDFGQPKWQANCHELSRSERVNFLKALEKTYPTLLLGDSKKKLTKLAIDECTNVFLKGSHLDNRLTWWVEIVSSQQIPVATASDVREFIASTLGEEKPKYIQQIGRIKRENSGNGYCDDHTGNKYHRKIRDIKGRLCMVFDQDRQEYVPAFVDFYSIERACALPGGGITHCAKKVLFCGIRGKGDSLQDLIEARDALTREIESIKTERAEGSCKQD